jgi:hypothetical protein
LPFVFAEVTTQVIVQTHVAAFVEKIKVAIAQQGHESVDCRKCLGPLIRENPMLRDIFLMSWLPSSAEEGWLRDVIMLRSDLSRADGVVLVRKSCMPFDHTTPSAPTKVAAPFSF